MLVCPIRCPSPCRPDVRRVAACMQLLYDTFSAFGVIIATPKMMRDPDTGNSRGFGFIAYDCFEASDAAIEAMNGQYLQGRAISVGYAFKKDTKGEARACMHAAHGALAATQALREGPVKNPLS